MKPDTTTLLTSIGLATLSAGLAIQTAMTFFHGGGNLPNAIGFGGSVAIFIWMMIVAARTSLRLRQEKNKSGKII